MKPIAWSVFAVGAVVSLDLLDLTVWAAVVLVAALGLVAADGRSPRGAQRTIDGRDLRAIAILYVVIVGLFRMAFEVFTTDTLLGLFLCFAAGLVIGVAGPIVHQIWWRGRSLESLGIGSHRVRETLALGAVLAVAQFAVTLWGYDFPQAEDWVPLLVMSLVVGAFEAVFFRGFVQNRLEASFGVVPGVAGASVLYALYHVGYGMGLEEMFFLLSLGVVYAVAFALTRNVLVLWPLLTPMGAFFNNLESGDIDLPWASIAGFADVAAVMAFAIWAGYRKSTRGVVFRRKAPARR